jgi:DNA-binding Xre family transcriptional regulator
MAERRHALSGQLTALRHRLGVSQVELAARMGTSQSAVARLETGDADVRVSTLERYAAAIGSQLAWLARADQPEPGPPPEPGRLDLGQPGPSQPGPAGPGPGQPGLGRPEPGQPGAAQPGDLRAGTGRQEGQL